MPVLDLQAVRLINHRELGFTYTFTSVHYPENRIKINFMIPRKIIE